jgi:hypothetical protein
MKWKNNSSSKLELNIVKVIIKVIHIRGTGILSVRTNEGQVRFIDSR